MTDRREADGVIAIDKPAGMTSHDVVAMMRRLYGTRKVGHTGTLDPMATGVLCVLLGRATKAAEYLSSDSKVYETELVLGLSTDTEDTGGAVLQRVPPEQIPDEAEVLAAMAAFDGEILQTPPMYSALKVNGQKLLDIARRGGEAERQPRPVHVKITDVRRLSRERYAFRVACSKGTYIRTLCADIGKSLGCGGCMGALRRTESGTFTLSRAVTLQKIEELSYEERLAQLLPTEQLFSDLPIVTLSDFFLKLSKSGAEIYQHKIRTAYPIGQQLRLYDGDGFYALGEVREYPAEEKMLTAIKPIKFFRL